VGERPCGGEIDRALHAQMTARVQELSEKHSGMPCSATSGSTDCNIPMSLGVPAVCVGTFWGGGSHTREEFVRKNSIEPGMRIVTELILDYFS
jgi:di/tripeptidase